MTAPLLSVGAPVVRQSVFGDWLIDDGSLVPQRASDRPAAFDEAAARSLSSGAAVPPPPGTVPESCPASPVDSGATCFSAPRHGAGCAEEDAGATDEVSVVPATTSAVAS